MTRFFAKIGFLALSMILLSQTACENKPPAPAPPPAPSTGQTQPRTETIELLFPYGSEKRQWLEAVTDTFNRTQHTTDSGKIIRITTLPMGSGETIREILDGHLQAHLVSPASAAFIKLGNAESVVQTGQELIGPTQDLVLSPVVIAMWKPMAEQLGWGSQPVGWEEILQFARNPSGWASVGHAEWGRFKFGHTHPEFSNSGLISLFAEVYAATGKKSSLTDQDIADPRTANYLREIEQTVVHYGSSTGFFADRLFDNGPGYLSAAVLYENLVIESYDPTKHPHLAPPIVAVYPKEGTFWSDHPVGIVQRPYVTAEHQDAAKKYIAYLLQRPQQELAMRFGFRPADPAIALASPFDAAHGVNPDEPKTTLEVPPANIMNAVIQLWRQQKKHANIVLVIDVSGSMKGDKIAAAKEGARELVNMLGDQDSLSLVAFSTNVNWLLQSTPVAQGRADALRKIDGLIADGSTALNDATAAAYDYLLQQADTRRITAVVVLTDGQDSKRGLSIEQLAQRIRFDAETRTIRVFTIGYGDGADEKVLKNIADTTMAKTFRGSTQNIRQVFKEISTFF